MKYDYKCTKCNKIFEIERSINELSKKVKCPKCKCSKVQRIYSPLNFTGSSSINDISSQQSVCPTGTCPYTQ